MKKKYWEMNAEELHEATKQFDKPMVAKKARPLTSKERELWRRAKKSSSSQKTKGRHRDL